MAPPFTPKLFRQHLDYIKNGFSSPISQPRLQDSNSNTSTPTSATSPMSPPNSPTMGRKRKADSTHPDQPTSKRTLTEAEDTNTAVKQMLVPVVSRKETNAQVQLHQDHIEASYAFRDEDSDDDFVDAEEDVADMSNGVGNPTGAETPFVNMDGVGDNGLSVWRSDDMDMPSSFMPVGAEDDMNLFPGLDNSFGFDGEDFAFGEPEYGQEGIDDGGPVQLDADGIPAMAEEPIEQYEQPTAVPQAAEQQPENPVVYDLEDGEDDPDLDAIIADANGTQAYALPLEDESEPEEAVEDLPQPQAPIHSQDSRGVHKLVAQDGQVDQFIVETGRTPEEEHQRSIYDQSELFSSIDDEPEEARAQPNKDSTQQQQSHNTTGIFSAINYTPAAKNVNDDDDEVQILDSNDAALIQSFKAKGYTYQASSTRAATPPLPLNPAEGISPKSHPPTTTSAPTYNVSKTSAPTSLLRAAELAHLNGTSGPTLPRDLAPLLKRYHDFHQRTLHLVPNLPNYKSYPWHRRYWIAILYTHKSPRSSSSAASALKEKDFMWMKGNRHSTISTIWHNYALRTMEEDFVLTCRGEVLAMEDCAEELDWFDDKLVVLRAVRRGSRVFEGLGLGEGGESAMWKDVGVVPREVVEVVSLDD